ncbi:uncharacterized protein LOC105662712 isoform X2 [Megachile rotundata]
MVFTACSYLALAGAVWIFLRLVQACFWLPRHLKRQNQVQQMLQDKVDSYEKYVLDCERKEMMELEMQGNDANKDLAQTEQWKERRECLEMLKKELNNVRNGIDDPPDWDYFLEEEETEKEESSIAEKKDPKMTEKENSSNTEKEELNITEKEKSSITEIHEDDICLSKRDHEINTNQSVTNQITGSENKKDK